MLNEEVARYRKLSGDTTPNVPISRIGGYLDGYEKALEQEPCPNAISRQAVKEQMIKYGFHAPDMTVTEFVEDLPPVNPQPKTGHWIGDKAYPICFKCNCNIIEEYISCLNYAEMYKPMKYCPNCGCRMIEPQERRKE